MTKKVVKKSKTELSQEESKRIKIATIQTTIDYLEEVKKHIKKWGKCFVGCDYFSTEPTNRYDALFAEKKKIL